MATAETNTSEAVAKLLRRMDSAARLVETAAAAVVTFYAPDLNRYLRDTLDDDRIKQFSTGGAAVVSDLWNLEKRLPYLTGIVARKEFEELQKQRNQASDALTTSRRDLVFGSVLGEINSYSLALAAGQTSRSNHPDNPRSQSLGVLVVDRYTAGWPTLKNVDYGHPYVARQVQRAALLALPHLNLQVDARAARLSDLGVEYVDEAVARLTSVMEIDTARRTFRETAVDYLWRQHGYSGRGSTTPDLSYDPVGTCHALDILVEGLKGNGGAALDTRAMAENEHILETSVHHILSGISEGGSLAYGMPFSYSEKGMGSFATSISGLAALASALNSLFEGSRNAAYPNADFLRALLGPNNDALDTLFALPSIIEGERREVLNKLGALSIGWSTDRARSLTRVESWVTMDVLTFAVELRLLGQEVAQFLVANEYRSSHVTGQPLWPYEAGTNQSVTRRGVLLDPDTRQSGTFEDRAPIQALHAAFSAMMDSKSSKWDSQVSAVLLFGPPGTAKSTLVKSLAQRLEWQFIELSPSDFVERGIESIEQRSQEIFESLGVLRETVVLFDELDSLLIDREQLPPGTILNFTVPAMLPKMQKLAKLAKKQRVLLVFATNFFDRLDAAMVRPGRIDRRFVVLPHDRPARKAALELRQLPVDDEMLKATSLAVFEELQRFADDYNLGSARCAVGITPSLYASRVPHAPADRRRLQRSMERLAIEVAEVLGRKFDEPRSLSADSTREDILSRLDDLRDKAASSRWAEWDELCKNLISALSGP